MIKILTRSSMILIVYTLAMGCKQSNQTVQKEVIHQYSTSKYKERQLSFIDLRYGYMIRNKWIKKPENIRMLHETFKSIGYENLIDEKTWISNLDMHHTAINKSLNVLVDSLTLTYSNHLIAPKYYKEFWQRRINESNDSIVFKVLSDIKQVMINKKHLLFDTKKVNDTLKTLLSFEYPKRKLTHKEADRLLEYLLKINAFESAHNFATGFSSFSHRITDFDKWNKPDIENILEKYSIDISYQLEWFGKDID